MIASGCLLWLAVVCSMFVVNRQLSTVICQQAIVMRIRVFVADLRFNVTFVDEERYDSLRRYNG
jgi:hypothetical protein